MSRSSSLSTTIVAKAGARGNAVAACHQIGAQHLRGPRDHEPGQEPDHGDRKETRQGDTAQRLEEKAPAPGAQPIGRDADEEEPGEGGEVGFAQGAEEGGPLDPPEHDGEKSNGHEAPGGKPQALGGVQRVSRLLTKPFLTKTC